MSLGLHAAGVSVGDEFGVEGSEVGGHEGDGPHYHVGRFGLEELLGGEIEVNSSQSGFLVIDDATECAAFENLR